MQQIPNMCSDGVDARISCRFVAEGWFAIRFVSMAMPVELVPPAVTTPSLSPYTPSE
ncbi:hypothetical protein [Bradyrhizobium yuanmingense]|uniref:hypothetical protein n=1 Tax=Bradyrhizobium yuanmingense TaxID=108015 RepID=UPI0023B89F9B|nr:hypothetical protein [Bradyrhizobium yuanmingense]MDF0584163.1 hypothetical protein [Bradyrhizobium yuanmingense]